MHTNLFRFAKMMTMQFFFYRLNRKIWMCSRLKFCFWKLIDVTFTRTFFEFEVRVYNIDGMNISYLIFTKPEIYFIYSSIKFLILIRLLGTKTIPSNRIEVMNINVTMSRPWHFIWANVLYFTLCIRQFRKVLFGYSERRPFRQIKNHDNCFLCSRS